ncbi:MAG: glutamate ligase domain-containing protein, partial [Nocardioidaceae bacterium]
LPREAVVTGLASFLPDTEHNPGRLNLYSLGEVTVVVDLAHNVAGLGALLEAMQGVRRPGGRLLLGLGTAGDRAEEIVVALGELAARTADALAVVHRGGLEALVAQAEPGDVVAVMCQQDGATVDRWLRGRGATVDDPGTVCRKVYAARQP